MGPNFVNKKGKKSRHAREKRGGMAARRGKNRPVKRAAPQKKGQRGLERDSPGGRKSGKK